MKDAFAALLNVFAVIAVAVTIVCCINAVVGIGAARSPAVRRVVAVSFDHDGHRWVRALHGGGLAHHPDCPCHAKAEKEDK